MLGQSGIETNGDTVQLIWVAILLWGVPIFVAYLIGAPKRRSGFLYGLFLGWIGVLIVAILPPASEPTLQELEKNRSYMAPSYYEAQRSKLLSARTQRECPFCKEEIRRDASVCPHCQRESQAWTQNAGYWWYPTDEGWLYLDEMTNEWHKPTPETTTATATG
jgi:hypothetical protein